MLLGAFSTQRYHVPVIIYRRHSTGSAEKGVTSIADVVIATCRGVADATRIIAIVAILEF